MTATDFGLLKEINTGLKRVGKLLDRLRELRENDDHVEEPMTEEELMTEIDTGLERGLELLEDIASRRAPGAPLHPYVKQMRDRLAELNGSMFEID
jgi:hypothetical protein